MIRFPLERASIFFNSLLDEAPRGLIPTAAFLLLGLGDGARIWLGARAAEARSANVALAVSLSDAGQALSDNKSFEELKARSVRRFKEGLSKLAASRRGLYEAGLNLQEEKWLLENLWEVLSTYLMVDLDKKRVNLMRGDQAVQGYDILYAPPRGFGGEKRPLRELCRVASKERFASPQRGKYAESEGRLIWEPPQVGTSRRANALGEYVVFTDGPLILHGPPRKALEHEAFPHDCLGLSLWAARRLYASSFVGTKLVFNRPLPKGAVDRTPAKRSAAPGKGASALPADRQRRHGGRKRSAGNKR